MKVITHCMSKSADSPSTMFIEMSLPFYALMRLMMVGGKEVEALPTRYVALGYNIDQTLIERWQFVFMVCRYLKRRISVEYIAITN
ncbi:hypothetical protein AE99_05244 [Klebsiella pneumoniae CHS 43]|nr:hypothetical protein AE80_05114 [Klebsiella pneumoniae CHS 24]KDJ44318.1 hypothetical protein AE99_05244 [Klebsiella pneumoniae CHS 43]KDJ63010.1 hypothetical protein AF04_05327 [Klebsiella pneumoniae CHS 48]KDJ63065.1 hypothetical protein AF05_05461 [Klebsiella pneumoniae CHS 49]KMX81101.1 hypothetical protein SK98_05423 [Klebsiella pneumoniae]